MDIKSKNGILELPDNLSYDETPYHLFILKKRIDLLIGAIDDVSYLEKLVSYIQETAPKIEKNSQELDSLLAGTDTSFIPSVPTGM